MNLKNYTSEPPAITSMGRIEKALVEAGATFINKKYEDGVCTAVLFQLMVNNAPISFKLPARVDQCFKVMWAEVKRPQDGTEQKVRAQAERTAWKIISDWVECQLSMIRLEQAEPLQVFLPYVYDLKTERTFYDRIQDSGLKLLGQ